MSNTRDKREYVTGVIKDVCESCGFDLSADGEAFQKQIDPDNRLVEANAILAANETLERLGINNFAVYISHNEVLEGIFETVRVPQSAREKTLAAISGFSKFNVEGFVNELIEAGVSKKTSTVLADLFLKTDEILNQEHDINETVVSNLLNIVNIETLTELGQILRLTGRKPVLIDPALPCESPGIFVEARTSGLETLGSGGHIASKTPDAPATFAFFFDIENIIDLMESNKLFSLENAVSGYAANLR